ncbi:MAG: hypothetical protein KAH56_09610 [Candidatus Krumholzibacteria bacterium]|nr:hypothetical protein [Candidatus Krumholzibacteria bacterium]
MSRLHLLIGFLILLLAAVGCSDDSVTPPAGDENAIRVDLDPDGADFTIKLEAVSTPDSLVRGPFFLRGYDLHYDDAVGALVVDLTITNNSPVTFLDPVAITFFRIIPEGTLIFNAPDGSPTFEFQFANDDLWWTTGEESLPLTVMFLVESEVSVAFNGQISVGGVQDEGRISGRVWEDMNPNGIMDPDEPGLPGVPIALDNGGPEENLHMAMTGPMGRYVFRGLEAGTYEVRVHKAPPGMFSTTPSATHVLLASFGGGGGSITDVDFGFAMNEVPPNGPQLVVGGSAMDRLVAFRGETIVDLMVLPGMPLHFHWEGFADRGLEIKAYRWGWDILDPDDPLDAGWQQEQPGLGPEYQEAFWDEPLEPGVMHRLVIHCWDNEGQLTRVIIRLCL